MPLYITLTSSVIVSPVSCHTLRLLIDICPRTCPRAHLLFSKRPRGSTRADMFVDINLADCTTPKRFGHIFFSARAEYNPKLITTSLFICLSVPYTEALKRFDHCSNVYSLHDDEVKIFSRSSGYNTSKHQKRTTSLCACLYPTPFSIKAEVAARRRNESALLRKG